MTGQKCANLNIMWVFVFESNIWGFW